MVPFRNTTLPVGVFGPVEVTVAVKVIAWPKVDVSKLDVSTVFVVYLFTTCVTGVDVLTAKVASPG